MPQTHTPTTQTHTPTPNVTPAPAAPPKLEDLVKRVEALEILAGLLPKPPHKDTITAYYKDKKSGKTAVYELHPASYEEAKNGRLVMTEQPSPVTDNGHERMVAAKWIVPEDAEAWSLEDPDGKDKKAK